MAYLFDPKTIMPPKKETVAATSGGEGLAMTSQNSQNSQNKKNKSQTQKPYQS